MDPLLSVLYILQGDRIKTLNMESTCTEAVQLKVQEFDRFPRDTREWSVEFQTYPYMVFFFFPPRSRDTPDRRRSATVHHSSS